MSKKPTPNRGHWPKGKSRNDPTGWEPLRVKLAAFIAANFAANIVSNARVAHAVGVTAATVGKWLRGVAVPSQHHQCQMRRWLTNAKRDKQ